MSEINSLGGLILSIMKNVFIGIMEPLDQFAGHINNTWSFEEQLLITFIPWVIWAYLTFYHEPIRNLSASVFRLVLGFSSMGLLVSFYAFVMAWYIITFPVFALSALILLKYNRTEVYHKFICCLPVVLFKWLHDAVLDLLRWAFKLDHDMNPKPRMQRHRTRNNDEILFNHYMSQNK